MRVNPNVIITGAGCVMASQLRDKNTDLMALIEVEATDKPAFEAKLKLGRIENLWEVGAWIMPKIALENTNATSMMMGCCAEEMIVEDMA